VRYLMVVEVKPSNTDVEPFDEGDTKDALWGYDMERAVENEIAQRLMCMDDDVDVTIHDVQRTRRFTAPKFTRTHRPIKARS